MERDGRGWAMALEGLAWEEPPGLKLTQTEREYQKAERRRVIYVAATRARDLLVIPKTGAPKPGKMVCADLLGGSQTGSVRVLETYIFGSGAAWARQLTAVERRLPGDATDAFNEIAGRWELSARESARPRFKPVAVSEARAALTEREPVDEPARRKPREGRFGHLFGSTVHQAIGLLLRDRRSAPLRPPGAPRHWSGYPSISTTPSPTWAGPGRRFRPRGSPECRVPISSSSTPSPPHGQAELY
jgi:ATP-dependent helicase/nuclease subunit A